ncbi:flavin monoamine oxidase family protein [Chitinophaga sp. Hz27]|uniref:flavin monoamine oxidase family protein n=1 Tax=Chitinophaga sp. Hz27 TaxID=3347169 RepID=UPI0035DF27F2
MKQPDVIIIGAGAAGLMAAYTLIKTGKTVTVLEARNRIGGRIHTVNNEHNFSQAELGAEFIHGNLPVTLNLLNETGVAYTKTSFKMLHSQNGAFLEGDEAVTGWDMLLEKMYQQEDDMPLRKFLQEHFSSDEYTHMRAQIEGFVNGYDTGNVDDISTFAVRQEWSHEDDDAQYRIDAGYGKLMQYLADTVTAAGSEIFLNKVATEIQWQHDKVSISTKDNSKYFAPKVIVALPLGILQASAPQDGALTFVPAIPHQEAALKDIGYGAIIKILLAFKEPFWTTNKNFNSPENSPSTTLLVTSAEQVPTFWTQTSVNSPLLTGWLGGPPADTKKDLSPEGILELTLQSLSNIFQLSLSSLKNDLTAWHVANWTTATYTKGSYAYDKVGSAAARKVLTQTIEQTIFFAGEYLYDGPAMGTVEAALSSGQNAANLISGMQ